MRSGDDARSAGDDSPASQAALLDDARSAGDASPASQAALEDGSAGGATKRRPARRRGPPATPRCWRTWRSTTKPRRGPRRRRGRLLLLLPNEALLTRQGAHRSIGTLPEHHVRPVRPRALARSNTLLVDCASMLVDSRRTRGTSGPCVARRTIPRTPRGRLVTSGLSILVLAAITAWGLSGAVQT